jgi:hypothetical protein
VVGESLAALTRHNARALAIWQRWHDHVNKGFCVTLVASALLFDLGVRAVVRSAAY